uniref:DUF659 domain-containing protein n=1 Tax=Amphimedon queenslandica TaxID=400682 RepID=A0A1X7T747_AMPQE
MLSCWKFDDSHTAENISANILSHIQSWDIEEKLVCVVRDNAANMVAGMRVAQLPSLPCLAHTLQLIIKDGIFQQASVQQLLTSARSIVGFYNRSNTAFNTFQQIQNQLGLPQHILLQDISTRWNSSFYMLQRLLEQRDTYGAWPRPYSCYGACPHFNNCLIISMKRVCSTLASYSCTCS